MSCPQSHLDAVYVLGALSPAERLDFERHLATCAACARAVQELAGLPGLLGQVDPAVLEVGAEPPVPETVLPAVVRAVRADQRRRSVWLAAASAAASAVVVAGGVTVAGATGSPPPVIAAPAPTAPTPTPGREMTAVVPGALSGDLALDSVAWGTRLDLTCRYAVIDPGAPGYDPEAAYALVVQSREGHLDQVATWRALPGKTVRITGATATRTSDISRVEVRDAAGAVVLTLGVPPGRSG
jgi:anti-sigma factor RsiW